MKLGSVMPTVRAYVRLSKPRQLALLMVTMYGAYFAAGGGFDSALALPTLAGIASIAGATYLNMLIDRDIDSLMERTRSRPLPSGEVSPKSTLAAALALLVVGILAAASINAYVLGAVLAGLVFDVVLYTIVTKRRTPPQHSARQHCGRHASTRGVGRGRGIPLAWRRPTSPGGHPLAAHARMVPGLLLQEGLREGRDPGAAAIIR